MATNAFGIDYSTRGYAGKSFAAATREQWNMYLTQFGVPQENLLINYTLDPASVGNAVNEARQNVQQSFDMQPGIMQRQMRGLGIEMNDDEQKAFKRTSALNQSLAEVNAGNQAANRAQDRQMGLLGAPVPNVG